MRDLSSAIEALREYRSEHDADWSDMEGRPTRCVCPTCRRTDVILAECEEPDLEDASLPRMPTSKRTVTLHEEPAETAKERVIRVINQSDEEWEEWFAGEPSGGGSNLPAPKRYRCRACEQEFDSKVGMHREHITDIDGSWCSGIVEETP